MKVELTVPTLPDPVMDAATAQARASLSNFLGVLRSPKTNQEGFTISARFVSEAKHVQEHIWISVSSYESNVFHGAVATTEKTTVGLVFKQPVAVNVSNVVDWMFVEDGKLVGGFTARVIRSRMTEAERQRYDSRTPFKY